MKNSEIICICAEKAVSLHAKVFISMKRIILVYLLLCSALIAYSNDFYRVKSDVINARSWASTSSDVIHTYKRGEVLSISEYHSDGRYKWGRVADSYPAHWVAVSNLEQMSQAEINQYFRNQQTSPAVKRQASSTAKKKTQQVAHSPSYYVLILLKVLIAIYAIVFFILLYNEAKGREKEAFHATYGFCCFALLFWLFFPGKWQWLWVGFAWGGLLYPLAYAKFVEKNGYICHLLVFAASLLCGFTTWIFLRRYDFVTDYVGYLNGFEVAGMVIGNIIVTGIVGGDIIDRCPLCHYFCETHLVDNVYEGTSYYDVSRTKTKDYWDHQDVEEGANNTIRVTDYYRREKTLTTSTYQRDYYLSTYYCPHCHRKYKSRGFQDKLINRETRRV